MNTLEFQYQEVRGGLGAIFQEGTFICQSQSLAQAVAAMARREGANVFVGEYIPMEELSANHLKQRTVYQIMSF